jgi:hypothetical protein
MFRNTLVLVCLSFSLFIYLFYRDSEIVINKIVALVFHPFSLSQIQTLVQKSLPLHEIIVYSLPGGLWVFSVSLILIFYKISINNKSYSIGYLPLLVSVGIEVFQFSKLTDGIFDWWDVVFETLGYLFAFLIAKYYSNTVKYVSIRQLSPFLLFVFLSLYLADIY